MATIGEMLTYLDHAVASTPRGWRHRRDVALTLPTPEVLGHPGARLPDDGTGAPVYGYTRGQCVRIRDTILAAARADATDPGGHQ